MMPVVRGGGAGSVEELPVGEGLTPNRAAALLVDWTGSSNRGDWDAFAGMLHPEVVLVDPMLPDPARGAEAALLRAQAQYAPFADGRVDRLGEPMTNPATGELAYRWRFHGRHVRRIDPPGFAPTGAVVSVQGVSVLRLEGERVVSVRLFFDSTEVARQIGAAPPAGSPLERAVVAVQRLRVRWRR